MFGAPTDNSNSVDGRAGRLLSYAAAAWAWLFALRGAYWALGGRIGTGTVSPQLLERAAAGDRALSASLWIAVALLTLGGLWALMAATPSTDPSRWIVRLGGRRFAGWMLWLPLVLGGLLLVLQGASHVADSLLGGYAGATARWYGLLWGPWFLLGGALFLLSGRSCWRRLASRWGPSQ